jgi:cytochrome b561/polyisoprenoid-binding protein YceI
MTDAAKSPAAAGSARYSTVAIVLHWLIAAAIVLQVVLAERMEGPHTPESFAVTQLHKSVGITILLLSLVRLAWRLAHPPAPLPSTMASWEVLLARLTHVGFYVIMLGMPLTGWIMVSASRIELPTLLYGQVPWPNLPLAHLAPEAKKAWHSFGLTSHHLLAKGIWVLLALHVAGALKHQLFSRDEPVLGRMAPGAVAGRWLEPRLAIIALAFAGVIAFGALVTPPAPGMAPPPAAAPTPSPIEAQPLAAPAAPVAEAPAPAPATGPVKWAVEPGSTLGFATAWSGAPIEGRFDRWTADIVFSPDALERSRIVVTIDVGSVNTGDKQRDATLPSGDWFDAAAHPKAVFTATRFERKGADRYLAHGTLELKGIKQPQDLAFQLRIAGDKAQASGTASLDRTAFSIGEGEFAATDQIPGKVTIKVAVRAHRAG